ncbi:MAG: aminoglycoside 6-adenylyltransferase [Lachnospiraceae bacterium]|nr:aminoglycoside 6-adenylyltransferase [Lachnospiraceae bacterium]
MRTEEEMYRLFRDIADADDRILAIYLNGSRTNDNAPRDIFQDYDIVYVVTDTLPFIEDKDWISGFGHILYMQYPDEFPGCQADRANFYGWLMQFRDGNRVDLHVESLAHAKVHIFDDKLCKILYDKKHVLPAIPAATDEDRHVKQPTEAQVRFCSNEFWWCSNNLAKGLWRGEMPYVQDMANTIVRKQLEKMLSWKVGIDTGFSVSVGKSAKYISRWLSPEEYQTYLDTYFGGRIEDGWNAVFTMCDLMERTTDYVADRLGYTYDRNEGKAARSFLEHVRQLPRDASEIFSKTQDV